MELISQSARILALLAVIICGTGGASAPAFAKGAGTPGAGGALVLAAGGGERAIAALEAQGYVVYEVSTTLLGRIRIRARGANGTREVVVHRHTGEVLRDVVTAPAHVPPQGPASVPPQVTAPVEPAAGAPGRGPAADTGPGRGPPDTVPGRGGGRGLLGAGGEGAGGEGAEGEVARGEGAGVGGGAGPGTVPEDRGMDIDAGIGGAGEGRGN